MFWYRSRQRAERVENFMAIKTAVLCSGSGTNLTALLRARDEGKMSHCDITLVVCDRVGAKAMEIAEQNGVESRMIDKRAPEFEQKLKDLLKTRGIEFIVLAGFLTILSADFVKEYRNRIINVHPSLIPSFCGKGFYGLKVHERALKKGVKISGATVHFVNATPDGGRIILQKAVAVRESDTPEKLQLRIMKQAEWKILPEAAELICKKMETNG